MAVLKFLCMVPYTGYNVSLREIPSEVWTMRDEAVVALAVSVLGAAAPGVFILSDLAGRFSPMAAAVATFTWAVAAIPPLVVGATAWASRRDRRASWVLLAVALANLLVGVGGWTWAAENPLKMGVAATGMLFVPAAQFLLWLTGAVLSGRRR